MISNAQRADIGRVAFEAALPHLDADGALADLCALVANLLHLADTLPPEERGGLPGLFEEGSNGEYVAANALTGYLKRARGPEKD